VYLIVNTIHALTKSYKQIDQYYTLNITDDEKYDGDIISTLALTFHEDVHIQESEELWRFWLDQQEEPNNTQAVEIGK
jgi:hypothetical protein